MRLKKIRKTKKSYNVDFNRLKKYFVSFQSDYQNQDSIRCKIMLLNHQLEKAQTYTKVKKGYGKEKIKELISLLNYYAIHFGSDDVFNTSLGILKSHLANPYSYKDDQIIKDSKNLIKKSQSSKGGVTLYDPLNSPKIDNFAEFLSSRRSCRKYDNKKISTTELQEAVQLAQTAPSACNRQPVRVHYYDDKNIIKKLIESQKADIDWCLNATGLIIITTNQYYYRDYLERNQNMFDAGLFSMNLNLIFHNMGIGSCFKMAQKDPDIEKNTKQIGNIPENEDICVLYCVGKYPTEPFIVAKSERINLDNVLKIHE